MTRTRRILALTALAVAAAPIAAQACVRPTSAHVVIGQGSTSAGGRLELRVDDAAKPLGFRGRHLTGTAIWQRRADGPQLQISLDCVVVDAPFADVPVRVGQGHGVYASGHGTDGRVYYLAISAEPVGADWMTVTTRRGSAPCGTNVTGARVVTQGNFTVVGTTVG